jgi:serine protease Do
VLIEARNEFMRNIISSAVVLGALAMIPAMTVAADPPTPVGGGEQQGPVAALSTEDQAAIGHAKSISRAFRAISKLAGPSVVSIEVTPEQTIVRRQGGRMVPQAMVPQGMVPQGMVPQGMVPLGAPMGVGTGFIVAEEGYVVTNNHVIRSGGAFKVRLNDGRVASAALVGSDQETDIAVLKIDVGGLSPIEFGDSDAAEVGDWVIALGSPFGLKDSVTAGIISARGREVGLSPLESYLQTDATINPGNSGGPLVDMDGRVVGINTAIESRSGGSDGISFAIPSNMAKSVVESIIAGSAPSRGFLGIQMQPLDVRTAAQVGFNGQGVLVNQVVPGGAAANAGVQVGDIVVKVNGEETINPQRVMRAVRLCAPGVAVPIEVIRAGTVMSLTATLGDSSKHMVRAAP